MLKVVGAVPLFLTSTAQCTSGPHCAACHQLDGSSSSVAAAAAWLAGWLLQACYLRQRGALCEMPFVPAAVFMVFFRLSLRGSRRTLRSHGPRWIQRAVLAAWAAPQQRRQRVPVRCTAGDEAYLLKLPSPPSLYHPFLPSRWLMINNNLIRSLPRD